MEILLRSAFSSATFLLASRIIEPKSSKNLMASFLPLRSLLMLANVFFLFSDLNPILIFLDIF